MTWFLRLVSCKNQGMSWVKHHQTSFPSKNVLFIYYKHEISAVIHHYLSHKTNKQHRTDLLQIARPLETPATCSYTQWDSDSVDYASWLSLIPFWLEAHYIFLRTSHFVSLSSSSSFRQHQIMAPHTAQHGASGSGSSHLTGASSNAPPAGTQLQHRHQLAHHNTANPAAENVTLENHLTSVCETAHSKDTKQHATGCE